MNELKFFKLGYCKEEEYTRVVCVCKYKDKYVFSYNKKRDGWEIPGGHIEENESWQDALKREMYEETGATLIEFTPVCVYKITSFALLCYCEIKKFSYLPKESEMTKILLSDHLPDNLTYPDTYKAFFKKVNEFIK